MEDQKMVPIEQLKEAVCNNVDRVTAEWRERYDIIEKELIKYKSACDSQAHDISTLINMLARRINV